MLSLSASMIAAVLVAAPVVDPEVNPSDRQATRRHCGLEGGEGARVTDRDCIACHEAGSHRTHPVDVDYGDARARRVSARSLPGDARSPLKDVASVTRSGLKLAGGKVTCLTCHDAGSGNHMHLVIPGAATDATSLCKTCHAVGDEDRPVARR